MSRPGLENSIYVIASNRIGEEYSYRFLATAWWWVPAARSTLPSTKNRGYAVATIDLITCVRYGRSCSSSSVVHLRHTGHRTQVLSPPIGSLASQSYTRDSGEPGTKMTVWQMLDSHFLWQSGWYSLRQAGCAPQPATSSPTPSWIIRVQFDSPVTREGNVVLICTIATLLKTGVTRSLLAASTQGQPLKSRPPRAPGRDWRRSR